MANSQVCFLHTFQPSNRPSTGWIADSEEFQLAFEEDCKVTNLEPLAEDKEANGKHSDDEEEDLSEEFTVEDLWKLITDEKSAEDEDDGFGIIDPKAKDKKKKKKEVVKKVIVIYPHN